MRVDFYNLQLNSPDDLLCQLMNRIIRQTGNRIIAIFKDDIEVEKINNLLWEYKQVKNNTKIDTFIPHGSKKDGNQKHQPIYLADADEYKVNGMKSPNDASFVIYANVLLTNLPDKNDCERCFILFNNNAMELENSRNLWKIAKKDEGNSLYLWQKNDKDEWTSKEF